jgi:N-acetylglucosamine kinase-like BadF-type ATPase
MGMKFFLGIDGGGTKTRAVLVNADGVVIGEGESGPANYHNVGLPDAMASLQQATARAWLASGLPARMPDLAFLGCAGIKSAVDIARFTSAAETAGIAPTGEITVVNDLHNALTGGLAGRPGIALIAGTGTNCLGRDASGKHFMCGGWGWLLDDAGGGFGLALAAMRASVRAADGRSPETRLLPALLAFLGLSEPNELLARLYVEKWTPDELAAFAPVVIRLAQEGDAPASRILHEGALALADLVAGSARALDFPDGPEVVLLGGCACSGDPYQPLIEAAIRSACPAARITPPAFSPVHGAALNALHAGGIHPLPELTFHHQQS